MPSTKSRALERRDPQPLSAEQVCERIRSAILRGDLKPGAKLFATMSLLLLPKRTLAITDPYLNENPNAEEVAEIARMAADELRRFREEILFADLEIVTRRIGKLEEQLKKPRPGKQKELDEAELELLRRVNAAFEAGQSPATLGLRPDEEKAIEFGYRVTWPSAKKISYGQGS